MSRHLCSSYKCSSLFLFVIGEINQEVIDTVSARELHKFLGSKQDFSTWIKNRIEKYEFVENQDYIRFHKKMEANNATMVEYYITLDMAKELSMIENNEKDREARKYLSNANEELLYLKQRSKL